MLTFDTVVPEETGVPSSCIMRMTERLDRMQIPMHSLLLFHKNKIIAEGYYAPCHKDMLHRMFSISKSFTSIAIGLLADEGKLALDDKIINYFPDKVPANVHPFIADMTIRDMLKMQTCHTTTTYKHDMNKDWVESFFTTKPSHPAGRLFHYDTSSPHTLCALVERLTGMPMLDYLKEKLAPLGLSAQSYMIKDPFGVSMGGSGLVATTRDLLKFACLIWNKGNINGSQLLSASYIEEAISHQTDTLVTAPVLSEAQGYGYQFWRNQRGGYCCYGMGGQLIIFLPDYELICITTGDTQGIGGGNQAIYDALYEEVLPYIAEAPLAINSEQADIFRTHMEGLSLMPLASHMQIPSAFAVRDIVYHAKPNPTGFETLSLSFTQKERTDNAKCVGSLTFTINGKKHAFAFGIDHLVTGRFPIYDLNYAASGVWLNANTLYIKVHIIDSYVGNLHFQLAFRENDVTVFMKKQEESLFGEFNGHLYCTI